MQIAKYFGAEVTGVCSTRHMEMVLSLGADHVVDYTCEDFTRGRERYDLIFDNVGNRSFSEMRRVLTPEGVFQPNSGRAGMRRFLAGSTCARRSCDSRAARISRRRTTRIYWC